MKRDKDQREYGVALVVTMIVMAVLAVVAVAFMQGATADRAASSSLVGNYQAMLAAEAGSECAARLVANLLALGNANSGAGGTDPSQGGGAGSGTSVEPLKRGYHDSVTTWQNIGGDYSNEATVLYMRAKANDTSQGARPGEFDVSILARPLVSGLSNVAIKDIGLALPFNTNDKQLMTEMVNLNATNRFYRDPWIGYRSTTNPGAPVTAARWVYVGRDLGPTNSTNPPIARYAYWVEDESFKLNLNVASNGLRGNSPGTSPEQLTMDGTLGQLNSDYVDKTDDLLIDRDKFGSSGFPDSGAAAFSLELEETMDLAEFRFLTTVHSAGLNLSRGGFKRFNINTVTNGLSGISQSDDAGQIRSNLSRVIAAITNSNSVPNFGQRFYRAANDSSSGVVNGTNTVTEDHAEIYLQKIAVNILDYIDKDIQPTLVNNDTSFSIRTGIPTEPIKPDSMLTPPQGTNPVAAIGVENVPRLQEYALHAKLLKMDPIGFSSTDTNGGAPPTEAEFEFTLDQYFEFWNAGARDIVVGEDNDANTDDLGPVFLKVMNQVPLGSAAVNPPITRDRDFEVAVPDGTIFPAGRVTVLTTSPEDEINTKFNKANIVSLDISSPDGVRIFKGKTPDITDYSGVVYSNCDQFFHVALAGNVTVNGSAGNRNDYETEVVLRNDVGFIDSFANLPVAKRAEGGSKNSLDLAVTNAEILGGSDLYFVRGGSLRGNGSATNSPVSAEGDPRALNEQLELVAYQREGNTNDQTRFYNTMTDGDLGQSSIGDVQATAFVDPRKWPDFSSMGAGAANAPLVIRNSGLRSIGELGHLTDPARALGFEGAKYSRGGGRTLRIGQSELPFWYDGQQTTASRTWTSWRLADVFSVSDAESIRGLINPNGVLRDGGAALRAALHGLRYLDTPEGAPGLANQELSSDKVGELVDSVVARLRDPAEGGLPANSLNVFWERGEMSELPVFNSGSIPVNMSNVFDRGREELVRRSIEMVTMRGSVFTVYVMAQALQVTPVATNVVGTARLKTTFEIEPQFEFEEPITVSGRPGYAEDQFDPSQPEQIRKRFAAPTNYTYRILSSSYE